MKLLLTRLARADILRQYEYYVEHATSDVAVRFIRAFEETCEQLLAMPTMGMPKQLKNKNLIGLRSWRIKHFEDIFVFYIPTTSRLRLIRILDGRRDVTEILGG